MLKNQLVTKSQYILLISIKEKYIYIRDTWNGKFFFYRELFVLY